MTEPASNAIDWPLMLETHRSWLTRVLRCRMGDHHAVDDALQEIALAVVRQFSPEGDDGQRELTHNQYGTGIPQDPDKVAPWLYRIAVRQAVNFHRKSNRKSTAQPLPELDVTDRAKEPLQWLIGKEENETFETAMGRLTPAQKEILVLKYAEKWSYQQLSEHLGVPVRSVEHRLLQARTALRSLLSETC